MLGTTEIIVIGVVALFFFGASRLKQWAKDLKEVKAEWEKPTTSTLQTK